MIHLVVVINFFSILREEESLLEERQNKEREEKERKRIEEKEEEGSPKLFKMAMIIREDLTLKLPFLHGNGKKDPEQHWFLCEAICSVKEDSWQPC